MLILSWTRFLYSFLFHIFFIALGVLSIIVLQERNLFDMRILSKIDPIIHTKELIAQEKYAEASEYLDYFMQFDYCKENNETLKLKLVIDEKRDSFEYKQDKLIEGLVEGTSDEAIGQASAFASDMMVIGDVRDLIIQGDNYVNDKKVDEIIVALSTLGAISSVATFSSAGATTPIKGGVSLLKFAKKSNKLPNWMNHHIIDLARVVKEERNLDKVGEFITPINDIYKNSGLNSTLKLLSNTTDISSLKRLATFSKTFTKESGVIMDITNNKALYYSSKMPNLTKSEFKELSTYGENGFKGVSKIGFKKFTTTLRVAKSGYKGNLEWIISWSLLNVPSTLLYLFVALSFLALVSLIRKIF